MTIDYRKLLIKYIYHVCNEEGTSFIDYKPDHISEEEWLELDKINAMDYKEMKSQFS